MTASFQDSPQRREVREEKFWTQIAQINTDLLTTRFARDIRHRSAMAGQAENTEKNVARAKIQ
jgi:hypothetical protein